MKASCYCWCWHYLAEMYHHLRFDTLGPCHTNCENSVILKIPKTFFRGNQDYFTTPLHKTPLTEFQNGGEGIHIISPLSSQPRKT